MLSLLFFLIVLLAMMWILSPLADQRSSKPLSEQQTDDVNLPDRDVFIQYGLADLEADLEFGKLDKKDFENIRKKLVKIPNSSQGT